MASPHGAKYANQRKPVDPPLVSLQALRKVAGLTIDQLIDKIEVVSDRRYTRGAISGVERGHRGASVELLRDMERAYGIDIHSITTDYQPRAAAARETAA